VIGEDTYLARLPYVTIGTTPGLGVIFDRQDASLAGSPIGVEAVLAFRFRRGATREARQRQAQRD
jgi:hypothetical protein